MYQGERFNSISHLLAALLALAGGVVLIVIGSRQADPWKIVSFSIYAATLFFLYLTSTLYHSTRGGRAKWIYRKLDHSAIYLLIAGTYTPFTLVTLNGPWGWSLFGIVWGLALLGIVQELCFAKGARWLSLAIYLLMGWVAVVAVVPLIEALSWAGFAWLISGGVIYTAGVAFYVFDERFRHFHGIWHIFVVAGSAVHYTAIVLYVA
ncbi:MAG TPA: hemolysin III family protein [Usitatibacteraceae bacterium]|nr:hemolysin III family protein [Usitatibacteraceae bacterium]